MGTICDFSLHILLTFFKNKYLIYIYMCVCIYIYIYVSTNVGYAPSRYMLTASLSLCTHLCVRSIIVFDLLNLFTNKLY
jgi:ABC-type transport system involved in Fe-S cluster assembly fused permease/ATPase subunit